MSGLLPTASLIARINCSSRNPAAHWRAAGPGAPPARQVSGTATFAIDSAWIAAASGGVFNAHAGAIRNAASVAAATGRVMDMSSVHADAVLDDDVVEIRLDAYEHFPDDVHRPEVLRVVRGRAI